MRTLPLLLLLACSTADDVDDPAAVRAEAAAPGPYGVGHRTAEVTTTSESTGEARVLPVHVWYPTSPDASGAPAAYLLLGVVEVPAPLGLEGTPVADDGPFPVAVYSHGSGGLGVLAYPYAERLASHGWVVIAADHVGNTTLDLLAGNEPPFAQLLIDRAADVGAQLDALQGDAIPGLEGAADAESAYVFGHSFGGYTSLAAAGAGIDADALATGCATTPDDPGCQLLADPDARAALTSPGDPRVDAIAPQAPGAVAVFAEGALAALDVPMLLMSGARDVTTPDVEEAAPLWAARDGAEDLWLHLPDGGHYSFISICDDVGADVIATFQSGAADDGCGPGFVATTAAIPEMATWLLAFGEVHVRGHARFRAVLEADPQTPGLTIERP